MGTFQWILIYVVFMVVLFLPQILSGRKRKKRTGDNAGKP